MFTITPKARSRNTIYVYAGTGASPISLVQTISTIKNLVSSKYSIENIFPKQIINDNWEEHAALLIIPGGADIPYTKALDGLGNNKIRSYVENGGSYLGICAGGYYSGAFVDFAKDTPIEVQGNRELGFYTGIIRGPILGTYDYKSEQGARAAEIICTDASGLQQNDKFTVYYNGGGYFVDAGNTKNTTILANYDIGPDYPAIVECHIGRGKAILSGVHFEYDPYLLDSNDIYLKDIIPDLKNKNDDRLKLVTHLLKRLNISN